MISLSLLTLNVPLQIDKCTPKGTCTPSREPIVWKNQQGLHRHPRLGGPITIKWEALVEKDVRKMFADFSENSRSAQLAQRCIVTVVRSSSCSFIRFWVCWRKLPDVANNDNNVTPCVTLTENYGFY